MEIQTFRFNPFQENTYVLYDNTGDAVVIDAGCYDDNEKTELSEFLNFKNLKLKFLINTHCHIDHILGLNFIRNKYNVQFMSSANDNYLLSTAVEYRQAFGMTVSKPGLPDVQLVNSDLIEFGNSVLEVLEIPGHTPGHLAFYCKADNCVFTGDTLFKGSIGRTDLPGGNYNSLIESINSKLLVLSDNCIVYPGHGSESTIGYEKMNNSFL